MIREILSYVVSLVAGGLLGVLFFGGLWWTIRKGLSSPRPALWFFGSMWLRSAVVLIGFYFVADGNWVRMLLCLIGFSLARLVIMQMTVVPEEISPHPLQEANHGH